MQGHELRVEVDWNKQIHITIKHGSAEIFGTPLQLGEVTTIQGQKIAIFTWKGCTVDIRGTPDVIYQSDDTCMSQYLNVHEVLQARRTAAANNSTEQGPRVFVVGPTDVGKSTVCKILLNYAVRAGSCPAFVDLDIGQGSITVPGCIAATPVEAPIDIQTGIPLDNPLVYYYGNITPSDNAALYKHLVERMAAVLDERADASSDSRSAGLIINSMGWVEDLGYELLKHAVHALKVDVVLVVGQERLYSQLVSEYNSSGQKHITVVKVAKSPGVVTRSREHRITARKARVEEYFYGHLKELSPAAQTASIDDLQVYRVGGGYKAPTTALPIGATSVTDPLKVTRVTNIKDLLFTMVAVSHASSADVLLSANVAGFVYIQDVDATQGTVTFLAPRSGQLPSMLMLGGAYKTYLD